MPRTYLQDREFRQLATLPVDMKQIYIQGNGSSHPREWETNDLVFLRFISFDVGGVFSTPTAAPASRFNIWGAKTPEIFTSGHNVLEMNPSLEPNDKLIDDEFPLWIRKIRVIDGTNSDVFRFYAYYFDLR